MRSGLQHWYHIGNPKGAHDERFGFWRTTMSSGFLFIGLILAGMIAASAFRVPNKGARGGIILLVIEGGIDLR